MHHSTSFPAAPPRFKLNKLKVVEAIDYCAELWPGITQYFVCKAFYFADKEHFQDRLAALELSNFEASFIKHTSFIDTTRLEPIDSDNRVHDALSDKDRCLGAISPSLRRRIVDAVESHGALPPMLHQLVVDGE